jgi:hypothetical protein
MVAKHNVTKLSKLSQHRTTDINNTEEGLSSGPVPNRPYIFRVDMSEAMFVVFEQLAMKDGSLTADLIRSVCSEYIEINTGTMDWIIMSINDEISKIPRKNKNGVGDHKTVTSVNIDPAKLEFVRSIARLRNVSIGGIIELALDRLIADIDHEV